MSTMEPDPPYGSQVKKINKRPPWQLLVFFGVAILIIIGSFTWFWRVQDEVYLTQPYDDTPTGYSPAGVDSPPSAFQANVQAIVGVMEVAEGEVIELLPTVAPLTHVGHIVQVRGEIDEILSSSAFILRRLSDGKTRGVDILVLYRPEDIISGERTEGIQTMVQGELVRFSSKTLAPLVGSEINPADLARFEGQPTIITGSTTASVSH